MRSGERIGGGRIPWWVGDFDEQWVKELLELDADLVPVSLLSIGYPAETGELSPRRHLDEMVSWR